MQGLAVPLRLPTCLLVCLLAPCTSHNVVHSVTWEVTGYTQTAQEDQMRKVQMRNVRDEQSSGRNIRAQHKSSNHMCVGVAWRIMNTHSTGTHSTGGGTPSEHSIGDHTTCMHLALARCQWWMQAAGHGLKPHAAASTPLGYEFHHSVGLHQAELPPNCHLQPSCAILS